MKFHTSKHRRKIKRYRKINVHEYIIIFSTSNSLIDYVCNLKSCNITSSSLYTDGICYQLLISATAAPNIYKIKYIIFKDKLHLDEIKFKSRVICKNDAILKLQKAFKAI